MTPEVQRANARVAAMSVRLRQVALGSAMSANELATSAAVCARLPRNEIPRPCNSKGQPLKMLQNAIDRTKRITQAAAMAPLWHHGTIAPRALKKNKNKIEKMSKSKSLFLGRFKGLGGMGVCGNHRKWSQFRACKIWWKSVRKTPIS